MIEVCFRYMAAREGKRLSNEGIRSARASAPSWSRAFDLLRYELARIKATDVVIEAGYRPDQVRADGWPYSNSKPEHHQVRVLFSRGKVPVAFFQSGFSAVEYNVWLIAMTLKSLRAVDRYGCTQSGEQYRGWAQLPPGGGIQASEWSTAEDAARFLCKQAGLALTDMRPIVVSDALISVWREAAKKVHPDVTRDNGALMAQVNRAKDFIEKSRAA